MISFGSMLLFRMIECSGFCFVLLLWVFSVFQKQSGFRFLLFILIGIRC